ncbi:hypothetical protein M413DRAFT_444452 [Hebeloma cylindrosporum]|uniref:Cytochrome P450 n=1 Tax=Hebeloma cylindrosporum TaxID=76867 RepID=A0A0C2YP33_HEBCY|nr:hypothetical protein M413DRAFT_444452 [Hebeloma cylindrosporum h7]
MDIPPGLRYLNSLLPFFAIPPCIVFLAIRFANVYLEANISTALTVLAILLARPALSVFQRYYTRYVDRQNAAANNAFILPHVEEKRPNFAGLSIMKRLLEDFKHGYPGDAFLEWTEKYGFAYQLRLPSDNRILTCEPDHVKAILATQFDAFDKGPIMKSQFDSLLGTGVFNSDGDMWKFHRSMTRPYFTRDRISHFDNFDLHSDIALKLASNRLAEGHAIDFQDLVSRFTLDSATQFLFGYDVGSLAAGLPYSISSGIQNSAEFLNHPSNVFVDAFLAGQIQSSLRTRLGPNWPLGEFWEDRVKPLRKIMEEFTKPFLVTALAGVKKESSAAVKSDNDHGDTLLAHLVHHTEDMNILKDELINLLVAGRDTTACLLTYAFYMLAEHPEISDRLRQEILGKVGPTNRPSYDDIRDMRYLRAFINEVLRLYPPVPFDSRMSTKATVWTSKTPGSKPFYIPANTRILYSLFNMQRRPDLWGPDGMCECSYHLPLVVNRRDVQHRNSIRIGSWTSAYTNT